MYDLICYFCNLTKKFVFMRKQNNCNNFFGKIAFAKVSKIFLKTLGFGFTKGEENQEEKYQKIENSFSTNLLK